MKTVGVGKATTQRDIYNRLTIERATFWVQFNYWPSRTRFPPKNKVFISLNPIRIIFNVFNDNCRCTTLGHFQNIYADSIIQRINNNPHIPKGRYTLISDNTTVMTAVITTDGTNGNLFSSEMKLAYIE